MCLGVTPSLDSVFPAPAESMPSSMHPWRLPGVHDGKLYRNWPLSCQFPVLEGRRVSGTSWIPSS